MLLARGADASATDWSGSTALHHAATAGHYAVVKLLLDTPSAAASANASPKTVARAEKRLDVDAKDNVDDTALIRACREGHIDVVKLLLVAFPELAVRNAQGHTALMVINEDVKQVSRVRERAPHRESRSARRARRVASATRAAAALSARARARPRRSAT